MAEKRLLAGPVRCWLPVSTLSTDISSKRGPGPATKANGNELFEIKTQLYLRAHTQMTNTILNAADHNAPFGGQFGDIVGAE